MAPKNIEFILKYKTQDVGEIISSSESVVLQKNRFVGNDWKFCSLTGWQDIKVEISKHQIMCFDITKCSNIDKNILDCSTNKSVFSDHLSFYFLFFLLLFFLINPQKDLKGK